MSVTGNRWLHIQLAFSSSRESQIAWLITCSKQSIEIVNHPFCMCVCCRHAVLCRSVQSRPQSASKQRSRCSADINAAFYPTFWQHWNRHAVAFCPLFLSGPPFAFFSVTSPASVCSAHETCRDGVFLAKGARLEPQTNDWVVRVVC